jgi:hypothetical protein
METFVKEILELYTLQEQTEFLKCVQTFCLESLACPLIAYTQVKKKFA